MIKLFKKAYEIFMDNLIFAASFAVLFVFVFIFQNISDNFFVAFGSFWLLETVFKATDELMAFLFLLLYFFVFSALISSFIFAVSHSVKRKEAKKFLEKKLLESTTRNFLFFSLMLFFSLLSLKIAAFFGYLFKFLYIIAFFFVNFLLFYVVQAIVIENATIREAIRKSAEFSLKKPVETLTIIIFSAALLLLLLPLEYIINNNYYNYAFLGSSIVFTIANIVIFPYIETLKTLLYLQKNPIYRKIIEIE